MGEQMSMKCFTCVMVSVAFASVSGAGSSSLQPRYFGRRWGSPPSNPPPPPPAPTPSPTPATLYVDGATGTWSVQQYPKVNAKIGDKVVFKYSSAHNVYEMATKSAYDKCDFTGATELASTSQGGGSGALPNQYIYQCKTQGDTYIACQVGSHCVAGQKVVVGCNSVASSATHNHITTRWFLLELCLLAALLVGLH